MHQRPNLTDSELEIRSLLTPKSAVNRDQLLYDCGYATAVRELSLAQPRQNSNEVPKSSTLASKRKIQWSTWLSLVSTTAAIVFGILLWQKSNQPTQLLVATGDAPSVESKTDMIEHEADDWPVGQPQSTRPIPNWFGFSFARPNIDQTHLLENLPSDARLAVAYYGGVNREPVRSPSSANFPPLPPVKPKTQQQLFEELTESMF